MGADPPYFHRAVRYLSCALLLVLACTAVHCKVATAQDDNPDETIVHNFGLIALEPEYGDVEDRITKWVVPVRIRLIGIQSQRFLAALESHTQHLEEIIHHDIEVLKPIEEDENVTVFILTYEEYQRMLREHYQSNNLAIREILRGPEPCSFSYYTNDEFEITEAYIFIPAYYGEELARTCIVEEVTQILGLANDSSEVRPSIFNDDEEYRELTDHDILLLKILYDEQMKLGMRRQEALLAARKILARLRQQ